MDQGEIPLAKSLEKMSRLDRLARYISDIANPLFLPPVVFLTLGWQTMLSIQSLTLVAGIAFIFYTVIPIGVVFLLLKKGHISSLDAPEQNTRHKLFSYTILSSVIGSFFLFFLLSGAHSFLANIALIYLLNPIIGLLINFRWKISIHVGSLAMAAVILTFFFTFKMLLPAIVVGCLSLIMLLLLLAMIWARHHLNVHTPTELLGGAALGIILTSVELLFIL